MFNLFSNPPSQNVEEETYPHYPGDVIPEDECETGSDSGEYALECFDLF
jgi:hypothetical protein